jgi:choline dehydrogenase-like flavoprotein
MTFSYDAIIIGTGQSGPSVAGRLTTASMRVGVIERGMFFSHPSTPWFDAPEM